MRFPPIRYAGPMEAAQAFAAGATRSMPNAQIIDRGAVVFARAEHGAGGRVSVAAFVGKGAKSRHYYGFPSAARADAWVESFAAECARVAASKAADAQVKKIRAAAFVMPYSVGDVLQGSWGYDQTNQEFYEVVAIYGKRAIGIRALRQALVEGSEGFMCEHVKPAAGPERFHNPESSHPWDKMRAPILRKLVSDSGSVNLNGHCHLTKYDGRAKYQSHYA